MTPHSGAADIEGMDELETTLGDASPQARRAAVAALALAAAKNPALRGLSAGWINLHCHSCFSYNPNGWTPSQIAWLAVKRGLAAVGLVDFDVLDGVDEFIDAGSALGIRSTAGMECRVFVPEFATREINSPGEPGVAYHMGIGFAASAVPGALAPFLARLKAISAGRTRAIAERVNPCLAPAELDYEADVLPLTPAGNATERHLCMAYARKARQMFGGQDALTAFWSEKLRCNAAELDLPEGPAMQNRIRAVTMKAGGVGYAKPDSGSFPTLAETNRFLLDAGAIPLLTWLDGTSAGEKDEDELIDLHVAGGAAGINIIPDRNYKPGVKDQKVANLYQIVEKARQRNLFLIAGTEMNSPGNKFVDDFGSVELAPLLPDFERGAQIVHGHTLLARAGGWGYMSEWSTGAFKDAAERNRFYESVGRLVEPGSGDTLRALSADTSPSQILEAIAADRQSR